MNIATVKKILKKRGPFLLLLLLVIISIPVIVKNTESNKAYSLRLHGDVPTTQWVEFRINGDSHWIDLYQNEAWYDTPMLTTEQDTSVWVGEFSGYDMSINGIPVKPNETASFRLERLRQSQTIVVEITDQNNGNVRRNHFRTLPSGYANCQVLSNQPEAGFYYFNKDGYVYKMSTEGEIVFYKAAGGNGNAPGGSDFKRTELDGKVWYSYLQGGGSEEEPFLSNVNYGQMQAVVLDENYQVADTVPFLLPNEGIGEFQPLENHQFTVLGEKHYLLTSYVGKIVENIPDSIPQNRYGARVVACVIQEVRDGQVVFQWDSTDHPELYAYSSEGGDYHNASNYWADYAHLDAVCIDPADSNFVCTFRHLDAVGKIDRQTGKILWILGGKGDQFGLTEEQKLVHPHDARVLEDGTMTIFNNGNVLAEGETGQSSILEFRLDEPGKTVESFQKYQIDRAYSYDLGSAQKLGDGHYVIGWGARSTTLPLFSEIDFRTGKTLFEFVTPSNGTVFDSAGRVYKFPR